MVDGARETFLCVKLIDSFDWLEG